MKVEPFLEHCVSRQKFNAEEEADARLFFINHNVRYIQDFYSQPFNPELITEVFEGIDVDITDNWVYFYFEKPNDWICVDRFCDKISYNDEDNSFLIPLTLNDFISDCCRNGIELRWKEIEVKDATKSAFN